VVLGYGFHRKIAWTSSNAGSDCRVILVTPAGNEHGFATSEPSAVMALVLQNIERGSGF
jgi:hypothetical protein